MNEEITKNLTVNPIFRKTELIMKIEQKHQKRMNYLQNNMLEKQRVMRDEVEKYMQQKNKELIALNLDPQEYALYSNSQGINLKQLRTEQ